MIERQLTQPARIRAQRTAGRVSFSRMASADAQLPLTSPIPDRSADSPTELDRLERAVRELIAVQRALRVENGRLRASLEESRREQQARAGAVRGLEERLSAERQCRHDALKRIDELISALEQLDPQLTVAPSGNR